MEMIDALPHHKFVRHLPQCLACTGKPPLSGLSVMPRSRDECLIYPFKRYTNGYGGTWVDGIETYAHRHMCKTKHGEPPTPEHEAAHRCGNGKRGCINPNHLRWATHAENMADTVDIHLVRDTSSGRFVRLINPESNELLHAPRPLTRRRGLKVGHG
jgi:hypothetical protein